MMLVLILFSSAVATGTNSSLNAQQFINGLDHCSNDGDVFKVDPLSLAAQVNLLYLCNHLSDCSLPLLRQVTINAL